MLVRLAPASLCVMLLLAGPDAAHYFQPVGGRTGGWGETWSQKDTAWKGADYNDARRRMAELIAALAR